MSKKQTKMTKASLVAEQLKADIIQGDFTSCKKLQMEALKERYGVGYAPIREALSLLIGSGMVQKTDQCGYHVTPLSLEEFHDLYRVRVNVEYIALELALAQGDASWEAGVLASWHCFSKYIDPKVTKQVDLIQWEALQKKFYLSIHSGCQSVWLLKIIEMLYDQSTRYRFLCLNEFIKGKKNRVWIIEEYQYFVEAMLKRDKKKAISLAKRLWENTIESIASVLRENASKSLG